MTRLGPEFARGLRSIVYEHGDDRVVKVSDRGAPEQWLRDEHRFLRAARRGGAPGPAGATLIDLADGSVGLSLRRVDGTTMESALRVDAAQAASFGRMLAHLQLEVWSCRASFALPAQQDRLAAKLRLVAARHGLDVVPLLRWITQDRRLGLCHGDLHPRNVILTSDRPVLVDWFDASIGGCAAETARTLLQIGPHAWTTCDPAGEGQAALHRAYLATIVDATDIDTEELDRWTTVQLVARIAEGLGHHHLPEINERLARW